MDGATVGAKHAIVMNLIGSRFDSCPKLPWFPLYSTVSTMPWVAFYSDDDKTQRPVLKLFNV